MLHVNISTPSPAIISPAGAVEPALKRLLSVPLSMLFSAAVEGLEVTLERASAVMSKVLLFEVSQFLVANKITITR